MTDRKEDMGAVTQQVSAFDDDMHKNATVKEANVASVALGKLPFVKNEAEHSTDTI
jgi:hypothetical protein